MNERRAKQKRWQYGNRLPQCPSGKRAYRSRGIAKQALHHIQSVPGGLHVKNVYRCRSCGCYHLTHYDQAWMKQHRARTAVA